MAKVGLSILMLAVGITVLSGISAGASATVEENSLSTQIEIYQKNSLTPEEESRCTSPILTSIGNITKNQYVKVNNTDNPLYCTFSNQGQALENIKAEASDLLEVLANEYELEPLSHGNWREYQERMNEFFTVPTDEYNDSNEDFTKLRIFFDIYENNDANDAILSYINKQKLNYKTGITATRDETIIELGLLFPYYAPVAQQAENKIAPTPTRAPINIQPAVDYAIAHATNRNVPDAYTSFPQDCTNFASQILEAGGVSQVVYQSQYSGWWHKRVKILWWWDHTHSNSWTVADTFARYMGVTFTTRSNYTFSANILRGDFIGQDQGSDGNWNHTAFITERDNFTRLLNGTIYYNYKVAQHTSDYNNWADTSQNNWDNNGANGGTYGRIRR